MKPPMGEVCSSYHRWDFTGLVFLVGCYHETDWKCNLQDHLQRGQLIFPIQLIYLKCNRPYPWICRSRFSSVGVATQLYIWLCGAQMSLVTRNFSPPKRQDRVLRPTQPPIYWLPELFPGVKRPERDVNPHLFRVEVNNEWSYTSTPSVCLHRVDFTFHLLPVTLRV